MFPTLEVLQIVIPNKLLELSGDPVTLKCDVLPCINKIDKGLSCLHTVSQ